MIILLIVFSQLHTLCIVHDVQPSKCVFTESYRNHPTKYLKLLYLYISKTYTEPNLPFDASLQDRVFGTTPCGNPVTDVTKAIVRGQDAPEKAWPWHAILGSSNYLCGGALISKTWVLTAAHCTMENTNITVLLGGKFKGKNVQYFHARKIIVHKDYNSISNSDDLALIKLNKDVIFNDHVKPICLPRFGTRLESDEFCYATGFGRVSFNSKEIPTKLQQVKFNIMHPSLCSYSLRGDARFLCLDLNDYNQAFCLGDSGGPLSCKIAGRFELVGIASFTMYNCSLILNGGIMMRVSEYIDWIVTNVAEADL